MQRVVAYVDGFNLYFGLRSQGLRSAYWLDLGRAIRRLLERDEQLVGLKYFTSRISGPPDKVRRQNDYLDALIAHESIEVFFGHYQSNPRTCRTCGATSVEPSEKQTDVNIAVELLKDAHQNAFDSAAIVSADGDLVPAVIAVRQLFPSKRLMAFFPPGRGSERLGAEVHTKRRIRPWLARACQLPDEVMGVDGFPRRRPQEWGGPAAPGAVGSEGAS
ncbi:MAG: NYN domain-containing protein [Planctomycetota bacterium]|nr:NYN domain-containing protein [Planctomycetota bacterium]